MEVKIGVQESPRELVLESSQTPEQVEQLVASALGDAAGLLTLTDERGRKVIVPAAKVAYVEISPSAERRVGFGGA